MKIDYTKNESTYPSDKSIFNKIKTMIIETRLNNPLKLPYSIFRWLKGFQKERNMMNSIFITMKIIIINNIIYLKSRHSRWLSDDQFIDGKITKE